ncbi:MAG: hypothetical protein QOH21_1172 [Acidobacteriota bacterium]|jgi:hypothetical protein|nr:hypothetical protein [Acidobacteriota bacterium]
MPTERLLDTLAAAATRTLREPDATFADLARLFEAFDHAAARRLLNELLAEILAAPEHEQPYYEHIHLRRDGDVNLQLRVTGLASPRGPLCLSEFDMLVVNLGTAAVSAPRYRLEEGRLMRDVVMLEPWRAQVFTAYRDMVELDAASAEAPFLVIHSLSRGTTTWVFDRDSLAPVHRTDNHLQSSRVQIAAKVLGSLGSGAEAERLEILARSDYLHFVRWEAAESVYAIDADRGERLLREHLLHDPHPSIRRAAAATLANLDRESA